MHTWTFSDGTIWQSGGEVIGTSAFAQWWREAFAEQRLYPELATTVQVAAPSVNVPLDLDDDYLLDMFAHQRAIVARLTVSSDYQPTDANMPPLVRELRRQPQLA